MTKYSYRCPHCDDIKIPFPMEPGPPPTAPCPLCGRRATRVYRPVPVQFHAEGFTKSLEDRPDERLAKEIAASQTHDPVTGESWEAQDRRLEEQKRRMGTLLRKDFTLPQGGSNGGVDFAQEEADRINRIVEEAS